MPCYHPLTAYRTRGGDVTFRQGHGVGLSFRLPCGQCIGCRLERSRQWALRCVHEATLHEMNCFVTLTYDDVHLPATGSLVKRDFQLFIKRLRRYFPFKISYYHCGEYGDEKRRPHYHALLFGVDFLDKVLYINDPQGYPVYTSEVLSDLWGQGFCTIGAVTFETAAYCARYVLKKVTGKAAAKHYEVLDFDTGEIISLLPEYTTMSLKPAIGRGWIDRFQSDVYPDDFVIMRGKKMLPPRYYDRLLKVKNPDLLEQLKLRRIRNGSRHKEDQSPERLGVREQVKLAQISSLKRSIL